MQTFFIKTLGCKTNQIESAIIEEKLVMAGYQKVDNANLCEIFILNSCSVTHSTDNDAIKLINTIKKNNPNIFIILTGCFAQLQAKELSKNPNIDLLLGNDDKFEIVKHIKEKTKCLVTDIMSLKNFNFQLVSDISKTRANLKIQDGCNNRCTYCTIPFARGYSRSNSIENIIKQIDVYTKHNFQEIILTGIHIGQWGLDFEKQQNLIDLLQAVEKTNISRYRLGSLNPLEISNELLDFLSNSQKFCPHFHLSLQSANNKILNLMNRKYSVEFYLEQIQKINKLFDTPFLGADIIVGFPNETQEDFEITKKNLESSQLSKIHVFPYSKRQRTVAFSMENQVEESVKKERVKIIQTISNNLYQEFLNRNLNKTRNIMIEKHPNKEGFIKGITDNYINLITNSKDLSSLNTIQKVKIKKDEDNNFIGEIET